MLDMICRLPADHEVSTQLLAYLFTTRVASRPLPARFVPASQANHGDVDQALAGGRQLAQAKLDGLESRWRKRRRSGAEPAPKPAGTLDRLHGVGQAHANDSRHALK